MKNHFLLTWIAFWTIYRSLTELHSSSIIAEIANHMTISASISRVGAGIPRFVFC